MEINIFNVAFSLVTIFIVGWSWKIINWVYLKPKRLEKCLKKQGFKGNSYRILYGDTKDIASMLEETTSKPMEHFTNDYFPRIFPFLYQTIQKYGENALIWQGPTPSIVITKPELIREILNKVYDFRKTMPHPIVKDLTNGLNRLEGQKWALDRKLINPAFHMEKLKHMLPAFYESCNEMIQEWEDKISKTGTYEVEMWSYLQNMTADVISRAAFGSSFHEGRRVFELLREHVLLTITALQSVYIPGWRFLPTKANKRATKIKNEIEALLKEMILSRQKSMKVGETFKDDLLGLLLNSTIGETQNNYYNNGTKQLKIKLSLKEVIEECKLFYIAGQEPTSSLLVWTLIMLSKHQDWQDQARDEILTTFGDVDPHFDGLNHLKKVNMILHEVLRLYTPATSLTRQVCHDITVGGKLLPAGVSVTLPLLFVHQDERFWGDDAKEFNPERFSEGIIKATGGNMCFFSYGWGPRICVGSNFAMLEVKMGLSMILRRFRVELSPSYAHAPTTTRGTLRPQFGANLVLHSL
ncbi:hypothetical protein vseg_005431 [Gypsophila vaccaria]